MAKNKQHIEIKNARVHNLKGIDLKIPHNEFVVVSGLSGSGKSSLAFDTLYAEGQRRYVESLSAYIRQFLGRMNKPEVDYIKALPPAIAIEQKVISNNPRSTVGTSTEIYEFLKLLFARVGKTSSPISHTEVKKHTIQNVIDFILTLPQDSEVYLLSPIRKVEGRSVDEQLQLFKQQGFSRVFSDEKAVRIDDVLGGKEKLKKGSVKLLVDRVRQNSSQELQNRLADSVQVAFFEGHDQCEVYYKTGEDSASRLFSKAFEADGIEFEEPTPEMFSFNNPLGACPRCEGFGNVIDISEELVVPNKNLSVYEDAIACWKTPSTKEWKDALVHHAAKFDFPIHKPYKELSAEQRRLLWEGNEYFGGISQYFDFVKSQQYKIQYRVMLSRYRGTTLCPECHGSRLKKEASYVRLSFRPK